MPRSPHPLATGRTRLDPFGTAAAVALVLCWGLVPVLLRQLTTAIDAWTANGLRYPLSAALYWPVLAVAYRGGHLNRNVLARCLVPALLALSGQMLWALAPYYLTASSIGFLIRMSLAWSLVGSMVLFADERRLLRLPAFYCGLLLTVGGFVLMSAAGEMFADGVTVTGVVIISFCCCFFGLYSVSVRYCLRGIHPLIGFGIVSQLVSLGTLAAMTAVGHPVRLLAMSASHWATLIVSSVLGIALGHYLLYTAVARLGAAITSGAGTLAPFFTAVVACAVLNESLGAVQWTGGVAMVIGAALLLMTQYAIQPAGTDKG